MRASVNSPFSSPAAHRADPGDAELGELLDRLVGAAAGLGQPDGHGRCGHDVDLLHQLEAAGGRRGRGRPARRRRPRKYRRRACAARAPGGGGRGAPSTATPAGDRVGEEAVGVAGHGRHQLRRPPVGADALAAADRLRRQAAPRRGSARAGRAARAGGAGAPARGSRSRAAPAAADRPARRPRPRRARRRFGRRSRPSRRRRAGRGRSSCSGPNPSLAAAIASTPEPQPRSSAGPGSSRWRSSSAARVEPCPPVPNARPGSMTMLRGLSPSSLRHHGGPTQIRPTVTGRW